MQLFKYSRLLGLAATYYILMHFTSCSNNPVDVVVDIKDSVDYVIKLDDDTATIKLLKDTITILKIKPGKHSIVVNNKPKQEFTVTSKGGLLNLCNKEFVVYPVIFQQEAKSELDSKIRDIMGGKISNGDLISNYSNFFLIDSFVVMPKYKHNPPKDSTLVKMLQKIESNKITDEKAIPEKFNSVCYIGKNIFFIPKFWDYNSMSEIPETISVKVNSNDIFAHSEKKSVIIDAKMYFFLSMFNAEEYDVRSIESIFKGENDARNKKEVSKEQLEFKEQEMQNERQEK